MSLRQFGNRTDSRVTRGLVALALFLFPIFAEPRAEGAVTELTSEKITSDLRREPREILDEVKDRIAFIDFDRNADWNEAYLREVFQDGSPEKKPALVLFYDIDNPGETFNIAGSIIFRELTREYPDSSMKFVAIRIPTQEIALYDRMYKESGADRGSERGNYMGIFKHGEGKKKKQLPPMRGLPILALYSPWDVMDGDTPDRNDRTMKLLDIASGMPSTVGTVPIGISDLKHHWIGPNVFMRKAPNGDANIYRRDNTRSWRIAGSLDEIRKTTADP
jgi:hypothetical protein